MKQYGRVMFFLYILILLTFINGTDVKPKNEVEKKLLNFFHQWRTGNTSFLPSNPLPNLDVINIRPLDGYYSGKAGVNITYSTSTMQLIGMNNFSVIDIKVLLGFFGLYSTGVLWIPKLLVTADNYKIQGKAFHIYSLNGSGKLYVDFEDIHVSFLMKISSNGTSSSLSTLKLDFVIHNLEVNLENSSWPINKVLNKEGVKIIEGYRDEILTAAQKNIVKWFDPYLEKTTPIQLLDLITQ